MKDKSINLQRTESLLRELVPEALGDLNDNRINSLTITDVQCKNGKYDAKVYYDGNDLTPHERKEVQKALYSANSRIKSYILNSTGWYKCPDFTFENDTKLESVNKLEELFSKIRKDTKKEKEE
ncbi:MAG: 30S ribosome-binding factor RbfA [Arcobacteraceae bacterium]|jgi:ribosome-binding factor A|nr:30S ribosome-binding factor RbfA [Arcobacteraceae bacterium]